MNNASYLYTFNYNEYDNDLCKLESNHLFNEVDEEKMLFSDIKIAPSCSAFIKKRLDIMLRSEDYNSLINQVKALKIKVDGFKGEYVVLEGDSTEYKERLNKLGDIGWSIDGEPEYYHPKIVYGLAFFEGVWYFGELIKDDFSWHEHKKKPRSFSNSIDISIAKGLLNIASKGSLSTTMLDVCCGAGTIMLEGCFSGYNIEANDINRKMCSHTRENLAFFNYSAAVHHSDIKDLNKNYDSGIIDLPYNLYSRATDDDLLHIIQSTANLTKRQVIVSTKDISELIALAGLELIDTCKADKRGKGKFGRYIWVCKNISK